MTWHSSRGSANADTSNQHFRPKGAAATESYEYQNANGSYAFTIEKGPLDPDTHDGQSKWFQLFRDNLIPFSDRFEEEDKVDRFYKLGDQKPVLYRLPELLASNAEWVAIAEGEKDVETLRSLGFTATCNPFGALKFKKEYAEHFAGRDIVIFPDNDEIGIAHAEQVLRAVRKTAKSIRVVKLPGLPPKGDVTDFVKALPAGATARDFVEAARNG